MTTEDEERAALFEDRMIAIRLARLLYALEGAVLNENASVRDVQYGWHGERRHGERRAERAPTPIAIVTQPARGLL